MILSISTAVPPYVYLQKEVALKFIDIFAMNQEKAETIQRMYHNSGIHQRHSIMDDFHHSEEKWEFWGSEYPRTIPGMSSRNKRYLQEAPKLAEQASRLAIDQWGGACSDITHVISVSCTGVMAPGIEYHLMQKLGLPSTVNRLGINFMGCFGAFKGLSVARAFSQENPNARILLVCTELCSLHLQANQDNESLMGNCLFADGSAAAIIGADPQPEEIPLWEIKRSYSMGIERSLDKMSWEAGDHGFLMRLSHTVPVFIGRHIKQFAEGLLQKEVAIEECDWAIHPGGKSILQVIENVLELQSVQTISSWATLRDYGNMSSATFLFVLHELSNQLHLRPWSVGIGFGPGLSAEGILLKKWISD